MIAPVDGVGVATVRRGEGGWPVAAACRPDRLGRVTGGVVTRAGGGSGIASGIASGTTARVAVGA